MAEVYKIGVIGDKTSIAGFLSLGFNVKAVENPLEASKALGEMKNESCGVVFITSNFYEKTDTLKYASEPVFTVIPITSPTDNSKIGEERLRKFVEKAVGADIL